MKTFGSALLASLAILANLATALPGQVQKRAAGDAVHTVTVTIPAATSRPTAGAAYDWTQGAVDEYPIHPSCNATERAQLRRALTETIDLARHARDHIQRFGSKSEFYTKYFGNSSTGEPIGWFQKLIGADKAGLWFRCDDIDGNCRQPGWGGHWRGSNASSETVICPLSYSTRKSLDQLCGLGYTVATGALNFYWAADLMHRVYHLEPIGEGVVEHYADSHADCLALARSDPAKAVRNTHSLQYFALDAYAYDIAVPGEGCRGKTLTATATTSGSASQTSTAAAECHTHSDGVVHCA